MFVWSLEISENWGAFFQGLQSLWKMVILARVFESLGGIAFLTWVFEVWEFYENGKQVMCRRGIWKKEGGKEDKRTNKKKHKRAIDGW